MNTDPRVAIRAVVGAGLSWLLLFGAVQAGMSVPRLELISGIEEESLLDYSALPHSLAPLSSEYIARVLGLGMGLGPSNATVVATAETTSGSPLGASAPGVTSVDPAGGERTVVEHEATNDDFDDAYPITSVPFTARTNSSGSRREPGEPSDCAPTGGTLWYRFAVARPVGLVATTEGNRPASVAIYSGTDVRNLDPVGCDTGVTGRASVAVAAAKKTSYYVQVTSPGGGGPIVFNLDFLGVTERVSVAHDGGEGDSWSYAPMLSADGRFVSFMSFAENLVRRDDNGRSDVFVYDRVTDRTELISVDSHERQGNAHSGDLQSAISGDGRYVAFFSSASNLVPNDRNDYVDVFVRDRVAGTTTRVSLSSSGQEFENCGPDCDYIGPFDNVGSSATPGTVPRGISITPDGRFVAFEYPIGLDDRYPRQPLAQRTSGHFGVYVHDRSMRATELVSVNSRGKRARNTPSGLTDLPMLSADGRYVAFRSDATNLVCRRGSCDHDTNDNYDVFVHDRKTRKTERVSVDSSGNQQDGSSSAPAISADGRYVAFYSMASNLVPRNSYIPADTKDIDVFVHDRKTRTTEIVSVNSAGEQQEGGGAPGAYGPQGETPIDQLQPAISADGRYVAFSSLATNLADDNGNGVRDIFLHDRLTGITTLVSVSNTGRPGQGPSAYPALSADAGFVAFSSESEFVRETGAIDDSDVFAHSLPFL